MTPDSRRYSPYGLVEDMLAVPDIIRSFDADRMAETARQIAAVGRLLMTGEGSSRLFPAKSVLATARRKWLADRRCIRRPDSRRRNTT